MSLKAEDWWALTGQTSLCCEQFIYVPQIQWIFYYHYSSVQIRCHIGSSYPLATRAYVKVLSLDDFKKKNTIVIRQEAKTSMRSRVRMSSKRRDLPPFRRHKLGTLETSGPSLSLSQDRGRPTFARPQHDTPGIQVW